MPKKKKVVVDDAIIDNPEVVTLEDVLPPLEVIEEKLPVNVIETGAVNQGKKEYKNTATGRVYFE